MGKLWGRQWQVDYNKKALRHQKRARAKKVFISLILPVLAFTLLFCLIRYQNAIGGAKARQEREAGAMAGLPASEVMDQKTEDQVLDEKDKIIAEDPQGDESAEVDAGVSGNIEDESELPISPPVNNLMDKLSKENQGKKVAYLTFDDGPNKDVTPQILNILAKNNIKATFFVIGKQAEQNPAIVKRILQEGHKIGNHSYSHVYKNVYSSVESFIEEIDKTEAVLEGITGKTQVTGLFRFPGGSFGNNMRHLKDALQEMGFDYINWNAINGDAEKGHASKSKQLANIRESVKGKSSVVILMHDTSSKKTTVEALPDIIRYLKDKGYTFNILQADE